jgi:hypothetical protein
MDNIYLLGIGLMVAGGVLIAIGLAIRAKNNKVISATHGSVAVGGTNSGSITNVNIAKQPPGHAGHHAITLIGIVVELIAIGVMIWHTMHFTAK